MNIDGLNQDDAEFMVDFGELCVSVVGARLLFAKAVKDRESLGSVSALQAAHTRTKDAWAKCEQGVAKVSRLRPNVDGCYGGWAGGYTQAVRVQSHMIC